MRNTHLPPPFRTTCSPRTARGFTLVELLVVIGIIALLISMLLPALNKAREAANTTACLSNMRQLGQAVFIYQAENKGCFPPIWSYDTNATNPNDYNSWKPQDQLLWALLSIPASSNARVCPSVLGRFPGQTIAQSNAAVRGLYSYKYNCILGGMAKGQEYPGPTLGSDGFLHAGVIRRIAHPSDTMLWMDYPQLIVFSKTDNRGIWGVPGYGAWNGSDYTVLGNDGLRHQAMYAVSPLHNVKPVAHTKNRYLSNGSPSLMGQINVCYADGSARTQSIVMGDISNACTDVPRNTLDQTTVNGAVAAGSLGIVPETRLDPSANP